MSITEVPKAQNIGFSSSYDKKKLHSKSPDAKSMDGICHKEFFFSLQREWQSNFSL